MASRAAASEVGNVATRDAVSEVGCISAGEAASVAGSASEAYAADFLEGGILAAMIKPLLADL